MNMGEGDMQKSKLSYLYKKVKNISLYKTEKSFETVFTVKHFRQSYRMNSPAMKNKIELLVLNRNEERSRNKHVMLYYFSK